MLPLAIDFHIHIASLQVTDPNNWSISLEFQCRFCNSATLLGTFTTPAAQFSSSGDFLKIKKTLASVNAFLNI